MHYGYFLFLIPRTWGMTTSINTFIAGLRVVVVSVGGATVVVTKIGVVV